MALEERLIAAGILFLGIVACVFRAGVEYGKMVTEKRKADKRNLPWNSAYRVLRD